MARIVGKSDAFGHALMAYWLKHTPWYIIERDDGYADAESLGIYFSPFRQWRKDIRDALKLVRGHAVDIGCGAGRHVLELQRRGAHITGIDPSPLAMKVCRLRGVRDVRCLSLEDLPHGRTKYSTYLMFGNNFGLFESRTHARSMLRALHRCSTSHARIIAECRDPYKTTYDVHNRYNRANIRRGRMYGQIKIRVRFEQYIDPWFDYLFVSPKEMRDLVAGTGWRVAKILGRGAQYSAVIEKDK